VNGSVEAEFWKYEPPSMRSTPKDWQLPHVWARLDWKKKKVRRWPLERARILGEKEKRQVRGLMEGA
jgi:hypothetical protein